MAEHLAPTGRAVRLRDESGFSLVELLTAQLIGGFVLASAVSLIFIAFSTSARVTDRVNSAAQGRAAMEELQQRVRSQTCMFINEYKINGTLQNQAQPGFIYATPSKIVFISDMDAANGNTAATGAVGFSPQIRYLYVDPGTTTGTNAYRLGKWIDGTRSSTTSTIPFNFVVTPQTSLGAFAGSVSALPPTSLRAFADGVTNEVTGPVTNRVTIPYFSFYNDAGATISTSDATPMNATLLKTIQSVKVTFRVLGLSGSDANASGSDLRTSSFTNRIYLKVPQTACD